MSFSHSTRSNPTILPEMDEHERLMRSTDAPSQSSYQKRRASMDFLAQKAKIRNTWTQAPDNCDRENISNVDDT